MSRKKTLLERMGLVEPEEEFNQDELIESLQQQSQEIDELISENEAPLASLEFGEDEDFLTVSEVYDKAGISNLDKSIFKVEEFGNNLPDNLPSDVKRQSVIGILTVSGLELEGLFADAEYRINALKEVSTVTTEKSSLVIVEKEQEIADLLNKIDSLKQGVFDRKKSQEIQDELIDKELVKISQILKFISTK